MGELHLDIKVDILRRTYKVDVNVGQPQVAYRETITRAITHRLHPQEADRRFRPVRAVEFEVEPSGAGNGNNFKSKVVGGAVPKEYIPGVEKGYEWVLTSGPLIGFPVVDISVTLVDGEYHDVDSSALAFEIATRAGLREALQDGRAGAAGADHEGRGGDAGGLSRLGHRRPQFAARPDSGTDTRGNAQVINAMVPLANMFGYVNTLRSMSAGPGELHHAVRSLRAGSAGGGAGGSGEVRLSSARQQT